MSCSIGLETSSYKSTRVASQWDFDSVEQHRGIMASMQGLTGRSMIDQFLLKTDSQKSYLYKEGSICKMNPCMTDQVRLTLYDGPSQTDPTQPSQIQSNQPSFNQGA